MAGRSERMRKERERVLKGGKVTNKSDSTRRAGSKYKEKTKDVPKNKTIPGEARKVTSFKDGKKIERTFETGTGNEVVGKEEENRKGGGFFSKAKDLITGKGIRDAAEERGGELATGTVPITGIGGTITPGVVQNLGVGAKIISGIDKFRALSTKGKILGGIATIYATNTFVLEPSELATWAAVDNIAGATSYQISGIERGARDGTSTPEQITEAYAIAEGNIRAARSFVNKTTRLNPKLWASRNIMLESVAVAEKSIADSKARVAAIEAQPEEEGFEESSERIAGEKRQTDLEQRARDAQYFNLIREKKFDEAEALLQTELEGGN